MTPPVNVNVDLSVGAAYIEYAPGPSVETVDLNETGSVAYDLDASGNVIGIEVLGISRPEQIAIAREFARAQDLAFPRDLTGALVAAQ
jgi:uncharacterized protein YuzE